MKSNLDLDPEDVEYDAHVTVDEMLSVKISHEEIVECFVCFINDNCIGKEFSEYAKPWLEA